MIEPIVTTIEVPCSQEQAFVVFVSEKGSWWPLSKRSMSMHDGKSAKALNVEAKAGGTIVEIGHDDTEHYWGTIISYKPHELVTMDFHMGLTPDKASLVEVKFTALADNRTQVVLKQSNFEAFGDMAEMMRRGYGSGWVLIFEEGYAGHIATIAAPG